MIVSNETWIKPDGFIFTDEQVTLREKYIKYCMTQMDKEGYIPYDWEYCLDGSIRHKDGNSFIKRKFCAFVDFRGSVAD